MIRIGIVGCGRILAAHLRGYRLLREAGVDGFEITALCARREEDALSYLHRGEGPPQRPAVSDVPGDPLAVGDEYLSDFQPGTGVEIHTDYRDLCGSARVDAVNDFTVHGLHHLVAESAFAHRKHLLTQKPLAVTMEAARRMCERAEEAGVTFGVFENFRFDAGVRRQYWALGPEGPAGPLQIAAMGSIAAWWAPDLVVAETPWRHVLEEGGGMALDLGPHYFDLIRHVSRSEVASVLARTRIVEPVRRIPAGGGREEIHPCTADDTFHACFELESGASGTLFGSWAGHGGATSVGEGPAFHGERGRVAGDCLQLDGEAPASLEGCFEEQSPPGLRERLFPLGLSDDFALCHLDWLRAVERGGQPECSGREGLLDLACAYAVVESDLARREVRLQEILDGTLREYQRPIDGRFGLL